MLSLPEQDFIGELAARVQTLQRQNASLLNQMASAAKLLNAAVVENQILKSELQALDMAEQVSWQEYRMTRMLLSS